ncbi:hypothetical protein Saro_1985 [Novosphingobium aromaticivorans DSM 12444]|uniref:Uncharacterized protein n=1 Tax=Novosphingobium aromaticivorans (strain ATCC 700278 / DSM 12444 / CCUG 56034 / CIP 105152 / NBRC 16084 / F199) TaxID=279238 RepID=Q2G6U8_NOVAD|nr:hypothetical protein [Novosphingobium aromaticivorans]ABD26425.1 hypothetical protein Saro_1985 [Novosphingobium aromaticivorans DSM 12444]
MTREDHVSSLHDAVRSALEMADRLGLHVVGIHLNDALECLAVTQDVGGETLPLGDQAN